MIRLGEQSSGDNNGQCMNKKNDPITQTMQSFHRKAKWDKKVRRYKVM